MRRSGAPGATTPPMVATDRSTTVPATGATNSKRDSRACERRDLGGDLREARSDLCLLLRDRGDPAGLGAGAVEARLAFGAASASASCAASAVSDAAQRRPAPARPREAPPACVTPRSASCRLATASSATSAAWASTPASSAAIAARRAPSRCSVPSSSAVSASRSRRRASKIAASRSIGRGLHRPASHARRSPGVPTAARRRGEARARRGPPARRRGRRGSARASVTSRRSSGWPGRTTSPSLTRISPTMPPSRCWTVLLDPSTAICALGEDRARHRRLGRSRRRARRGRGPETSGRGEQRPADAVRGSSHDAPPRRRLPHGRSDRLADRVQHGVAVLEYLDGAVLHQHDPVGERSRAPACGRRARWSRLRT